MKKGFWVIQESEAKEAFQDHKVTKDEQEMLDWKDRLYVITAVNVKQVVRELPTWNNKDVCSYYREKMEIKVWWGFKDSQVQKYVLILFC